MSVPALLILLIIAHAAACIDDADCQPSSKCKVSYCYLSECAEFDKLCEGHDICNLPMCEPDRGCYYQEKDCSDGDACTLDQCSLENGCFHQAVKCDDGNPCTRDMCDKEQGCIFTSLECALGNKCNADGECTPSLLTVILISAAVCIPTATLSVLAFLFYPQIMSKLACRGAETRT